MSIDVKTLENNYREYIANHKQNVEKAWLVMKSNSKCLELITKNLNTNTESAVRLIDALIESHDISKYEAAEFDAYRKNFYPVNEEEKESNTAAFDIAWKHHYTNNLHHWNWWYESGNMDNMQMPYVVEMICDWEAMGYKFGGNSKEYYEKNKQKIFLGERQKLFAEQLMNIVCK